MTKIVDTAAPVTRYLPGLKAAGVETVIRYLTEYTGTYKIVRPDEARAIAAAGMKLGLVFEDLGGTRGYSDINAAEGVKDAHLALQWAPLVGAPKGAIIWFAVDTDAYAAQINGYIIPYFRNVKATLGDHYRVGIYACGNACAGALDAGVADAAWLSNAKGWGGYWPFYNSKRWSLLQHLPVKIAGLDVDPDEANGDYGAFVPWGSAAPVEPGKPAEIVKPILRKGASGPDVIELRKALNAKRKPIDADGKFDAELELEVKLFQMRNGLTVDGAVGDQTRGALK